MDDKKYTAEDVAKVAIIYSKVSQSILDEAAGRGDSSTAFVKAGYERDIPAEVRQRIAKLEILFEKDDDAFTKAVQLKKLK